MFSVFESFFRASLEREERPPGIANVGVFTLRRLLYDCSARACGPDEPGGDPRGPGGEAQWPGGGYTAWTERATKSPAWEKGLTLFPRWCSGLHQGLVCLQLAPPRPPGTDLKVDTESRRH